MAWAVLIRPKAAIMLAVGVNTNVPVLIGFISKRASLHAPTNSRFPPLSYLGYLTPHHWQHHKESVSRAIFFCLYAASILWFTLGRKRVLGEIWQFYRKTRVIFGHLAMIISPTLYCYLGFLHVHFSCSIVIIMPLLGNWKAFVSNKKKTLLWQVSLSVMIFYF